MDDDNGEHFLKVMKPLLSQHGICLAFIQQTAQKNRFNDLAEINNFLSKFYLLYKFSKARIYVVYGDTGTIRFLKNGIYSLNDKYVEHTSVGKVWITTSQTDFVSTRLDRDLDLTVFHGSISLAIHSQEIQGFHKFLQTIKPYGTLEDGFIKAFWEQAFECTFPSSLMRINECTGKERLESLPRLVFEMHMSGHSYIIYNAVYAVAYALHAIYSSWCNKLSVLGCRGREFHDIHPWQVIAT